MEGGRVNWPSIPPERAHDLRKAASRAVPRPTARTRKSRRGPVITGAQIANSTAAADKRPLSDAAGVNLLANLTDKLANSAAKQLTEKGIIMIWWSRRDSNPRRPL